MKVGKNIATINVQLRDQDTNKLVAQVCFLGGGT